MMKKLKIGLVFDDSLDKNDGVQQYVKVLGRWLIDRGHDVKFLVGQTDNAGELQSRVYSLSKNMQIRGNKNKMFLPIVSSRKDIIKALKKENFDILHIMMPFNPLMGSRVIKYSKETPKIGTFHMVGGTRFINIGAYILSIVQRHSLNSIDKFLSVSKAAQEFEKQYFNIDSTISANMVEISSYAQGRRLNKLRGKTGTIVFLGRLVERKGARHLLEALSILQNNKKLDGVIVHICGDGDLRPDLERYVKRNNLEDKVIFHGFISNSEKRDYLASADISIFPSTSGEAFGIVLIEAMATNRCVVIGGNNSGYSTVLGDRPELLFDPFDHKHLANKIDYFLNNKSQAKKAIAWQTQTVKRYDVDKIGREIEVYYLETITNKFNGKKGG